MKIGILQAGHVPEVLQPTLGTYADMFETLLDGHGFTFQTWDVVDMAFPNGPDDADGWLVTGSRHGAYDPLPFIAPLEELIRAIDTSGKPLIGVCFGHQIIAQALGGRVEKFSGGWSVGRTEYQMADGALVTLNAWHQDQVIEAPTRAKTEASSDFCKHAILSYGDTIWTVQAHPEFGADMVEGLARTRGRGTVPDDLLDQAMAQLTSPTDRQAIAVQMAARFLKARKGAHAA